MQYVCAFSHKCVVGYTGSSYAANKNFIVGAQFEKVGANSTVSFDDLLKPTQVGEWGDGEDDSMGNAPMIMNYVNGGYDYYYYISDATYDEDQDYEPVGYDCWADRDGIILKASKLQTIGNGFWIRMQDEGSVGDATFSGQVSERASVSTSVTAGKNKIVINPFPTVLDWDKLSFSDTITPGAWGDGEDDTMGDAPMIMNYINGGYDYYYYISDATYDEDQDYEPIGYDCWADRDGIIMKDSKRISVGGGFWLRTEKNGEAIFTR